ncbi:MAG: 3-phosphoshikimate 1-carboxyvinyltransferase [Lachnospiraceae bacterium]|nr:3-phosphoshikimate 1-carboxyvinyltransferase [Lachnospiraceae bacterium]
MIVNIKPSIANGVIKAPPSKSLQHRYLICAALSDGESRIENIAYSKDIEASIECAEALGAVVQKGEDDVVINGIDTSLNLRNKKTVFNCNESGSTMRFFMGVAMGLGLDASFYGSDTLLNRPMGIYEDICKDQGILFERNDDHIRISGRLRAGNFSVHGNISSQFITGLLFSLPLLENDSVIKLIPPVESRSYIDLTLDALCKYGITVEEISENEFQIEGSSKYHAFDTEVEGDCSNAAFLDAFNLFGGNVEVLGLNKDSHQGDRVYKDLFKKLNESDPVIDISDCPDLGPILMGVGALKNGAVFTGTKRLKIKESDRGSVMCKELAKMGVNTLLEEDRITVYGSSFHAPDVPIDSNNDHRIAMTFAVLLSVTGGSINDAAAVDKSFPGFFEDIKKLGIDCDIKN